MTVQKKKIEREFSIDDKSFMPSEKSLSDSNQDSSQSSASFIKETPQETKMKKREDMKTLVKEFELSNRERHIFRSEYYNSVAESNLLSVFTKTTPENLVESGYKTNYHDRRIKKLEASCCVLHILILLFTIAYYELNYNDEDPDDYFQFWLLYSLHATSLFLGTIHPNQLLLHTCVINTM